MVYGEMKFSDYIERRIISDLVIKPVNEEIQEYPLIILDKKTGETYQLFHDKNTSTAFIAYIGENRKEKYFIRIPFTDLKICDIDLIEMTLTPTQAKLKELVEKGLACEYIGGDVVLQSQALLPEGLTRSVYTDGSPENPLYAIGSSGNENLILMEEQTFNRFVEESGIEIRPLQKTSSKQTKRPVRI